MQRLEEKSFPPPGDLTLVGGNVKIVIQNNTIKQDKASSLNNLITDTR
jgi:hypothetical protein